MLAIREFLVCICTQNALPDPEVQNTWANEVWTNTCKTVEEEYEVTDHVISLIKTRTSNACAPIKDAMCPLIEVVFGLEKTSITTSKQSHHNIKQIQSALNGSFIYKDQDNLTSLYETKLISEGIHAAWFSEKKVLGVEFSEYFKPIPIVTIALVLTVMEFCLKEWQTGVFVKAKFDESTISESYRAHLKGVSDWQKGNLSVVDKIRKKFFNHTMRYSGAETAEKTGGLFDSTKLCVQAELANRTSETDSEDEGQDDGGDERRDK